VIRSLKRSTKPSVWGLEEGEAFLGIPERADAAAHAVAAHERRSSFDGWSILDKPGASSPDQRERRFVGAHSDVGGGYEDSNLSDAAFMWMVKQAREQGGLPAQAIEQSEIEKQSLNEINNPIVHDEIGNSAVGIPGIIDFEPERTFRYLDEGGKTDVKQIDYDSPYGSDDLDVDSGLTFLNEDIYQDEIMPVPLADDVLIEDGNKKTTLAQDEDGNYPYEDWLQEHYGLSPDSPYELTIKTD